VLSAGDSTPLAAVRVQLERRAKDTDVGMNEYAIWKSDSVMTDDRGRFALEHVPAGVIRILADGVRVQQLPLEGSADRHVEVRLDAKNAPDPGTAGGAPPRDPPASNRK
jgi:hypothetical protein